MKKKPLLLFLSLILLAVSSCKKSNTESAAPEMQKVAFDPIKISYQDTTSLFRSLQSKLNLNLNSSKKNLSSLSIQSQLPDPRIQLDYQGNGKYNIIAYNNTFGDNHDCIYSYFKNGVAANFPEYQKPTIETNNPGLVFSDTPAPGKYTIIIHYNEGTMAGVNITMDYTIYPKPVVPAGELPLLRYYDVYKNRHVYSSNWEEYASGYSGLFFEKIQGYLSVGTGPNLVLVNRYYNSSSNDHWISTTNAAFPSYKYEGGLGYVNISNGGTTDMSQQLIEYFSNYGGHLYSSPPEAPSSDFHLNGTVGYLYKPL